VGTDVPFTMEYYAYRDCSGGEVVRFVRTFDVSRGLRRRFDGTIVHSERRAGVVDYLGTCSATGQLHRPARGHLKFRELKLQMSS
jgi:hypothetical protein